MRLLEKTTIGKIFGHYKAQKNFFADGHLIPTNFRGG